MIEYVTGTAIGAGVSYAGGEAARLARRVWGAQENPASISSATPYHEVISSLMQCLGILYSKQYRMKLNFNGSTVTRCPKTKFTGLMRRWYGEGRKDTKKLVDIAVRAVRWYDPHEESSFGESVHFLYENAIKGLAIYCETYSSDRGEATDEAIESIMKAKTILEIKLNGYSEEESDESTIFGRSVREKQIIKLRKRVNDELPTLIKDQAAMEEDLKKAGQWRDSQSLWVIRDEHGNVEMDKLSPLVLRIKNLFTLQEKIEGREMHWEKSFNTEQEEIENAMYAKSREFDDLMS